MSRLTQLPQFSLALLLATYIALGWILADSKLPWYIVLLAAALVLLLTETLAAPFSNIRNIVIRSFSSDGKAFAIVMLVSFCAAALVIWIDIVARVMVLIAAGLLARLDLRRTRLGQWQTFWILTVLSLMGFGLGWAMHDYFYLQLG
jgi:hypothetical protein